MPEIEITEDQREYLEALRQDIKQDVVGKYAHVRMIDAVQYLIDNHEGEINATVSEPSTGPDVSTENAPEQPEETAAEPAEDADDEAKAGDASDGDEAEEGDDASADAPSTPPMPAGGGDDDMLSAMMQLMDTHDDKWEEASGDTGYEVDLPDGETESAATQDDVRALLFKHYE